MSKNLPIPLPVAERWFALAVKPRQESLAASALAAKDIEGFAPSYIVRRRWSDRVKVLREPLFPGYIFCRTSFRTPVLPLPGVHGFVSFGGRPEPIPDPDIDAIIRMTQSGRPLDPLNYLRAGERVRLVTGPLRGVEGVLLVTDEAIRVVVGIEFLGRAVSVKVERTEIEPLTPLLARICA